MSDSKIEIKIGQITFSGEGQPEWVAKQLDKILAQAEKLIQLAPASSQDSDGGDGHKPMTKDAAIAKLTLPAFLEEKKAKKSQVKKFLATAVWLEAKDGKRLATSDVSKALKQAKQAKLGNPADCLNQNIGKGYCEKDGKQFFVTGEGARSL